MFFSGRDAEREKEFIRLSLPSSDTKHCKNKKINSQVRNLNIFTNYESLLNRICWQEVHSSSQLTPNPDTIIKIIKTKQLMSHDAHSHMLIAALELLRVIY